MFISISRVNRKTCDGADLRLGKRSEGSDQDIVILGVRCFNGHVDDVDWVVLCILREQKPCQLTAKAQKVATGIFYILATLTLRLSSS